MGGGPGLEVGRGGRLCCIKRANNWKCQSVFATLVPIKQRKLLVLLLPVYIFLRGALPDKFRNETVVTLRVLKYKNMLSH